MHFNFLMHPCLCDYKLFVVGVGVVVVVLGIKQLPVGPDKKLK